MRCIVLRFNSTTVQLIQVVKFNSIASKVRFNSTTVQLIHQRKVGVRTIVHQFQFHNGTINTLTNTQKKQLKMSELANNKYAFYMINYVDG